MDYDSLLETITLIGQKMIECGGEINRAETSVTRILQHYHAEDIAAFAISNQITVSASFEGKTYTIMKRVSPVSINFHRLDELNDLSRKLCKEDVSLDEMKQLIYGYLNEKDYPLYKIIIGSLLCTAGFSVFFGGDWLDMLVSATLGMIIVLFNHFMGKKINGFVHIAIESFITGLLGILLYKLGIGHHLDKMLIGTVMLLIPGMALTNGVRDVFLGDTISGTLRVIESLLTAICIAVGYGFAIYLLSRGTEQNPGTNVPWYLVIISGCVGSIGYGLLFHMRLKTLILAGIGTLICLISYILVDLGTDIIFLIVFLGALSACFYSELCARYAKMPAICLLTIGVMPIYPGASLYYTLSYLVYGNMPVFKENIISTGLKTLAIACAVVLTSVLFKYVHRLLNQIKRKNA